MPKVLPDTILEKLASILATKEFLNLRHLSVSGIGFDHEDIFTPLFPKFDSPGH